MAITHLPRVAFINALENYPVKALWIGRRTRGMWINSSEIMGASEIEWVGAMSGWNISTRVCLVCVLRVCSLAVVLLYIYTGGVCIYKMNVFAYLLYVCGYCSVHLRVLKCIQECKSAKFIGHMHGCRWGHVISVCACVCVCVFYAQSVSLSLLLML